MPFGIRSLLRTKIGRMNLQTKVEELKGVGPKTSELLRMRGLCTAEDLVLYYPSRYEKYVGLSAVSQTVENTECAVLLTVIGRGSSIRAKGRSICHFKAGDATGDCRITFFNMPYMVRNLPPGAQRVFMGTMKRSPRGLSYMEQPRVYTKEEYHDLEGTLQPVYPLFQGMKNRQISALIRQVMQELPEFPDHMPDQDRERLKLCTRDRALRSDRHFINMMAEANWFSASASADGAILALNTDHIENLDADAAGDLVRQALERGGESGFLHDYLYSVRDLKDGRIRVVMLNCETRLTTVRTLILISAIACVGAALLAWLLVTLASRRAVEPIIRNMEQQKQFITNASHELKTPLTVITTNMDLLQMDQPGNPWVSSTQKQAAQMRRLVDELVYLSRMEEENAQLAMESLPFDQVLEETAEPFAAMAEYQGKTFRIEREKDLTVQGDRASVQRLLTTLLDNAVKYAAPEGGILVKAEGDGKYAVLTVENTVEKPLTEDQCRQLFDRFYRADPSRNKEKQNLSPGS